MKIFLKSVFLVALLASSAFAQPEDLKKTINECSNSFFGIAFKDKNGTALEPYKASFWVFNKATHERLWPINDILDVASPGSTYELNMGPSANRVVDRNQANEDHIITVTFQYGNDCVGLTDCYWQTEEYLYRVRKIVNANCNPIGTTPTYGPTPIPTITRTTTPTATRTRTMTPVQ